MSVSPNLARMGIFSVIFMLTCSPVANPQLITTTQQPHETPAAIDIPIIYERRLPIVSVTDKRLGPLQMLLDTGTETTILDSSVASKGAFDNQSKPFDSLRGSGPGKSRVLGSVHLELLGAAAIILSNNAAVLDLQQINKSMQRQIDGILGWDFFQQWCVRLDYIHQQLTLTPTSTCEAPAGDHGTLDGEWLTSGFLLPTHLTFSSGQGTNALLHLDTGSDAFFTLNTHFHSFAKFKNPSSPQQEHGVNGDFISDYTELSSVDFDHGQFVIDGGTIPVFIARKGGFNTGHWWNTGKNEAQMNHDGTVGNGLLQNLTLIFDPDHHKIYTVIAKPNEGR